MSYMGSTLPSLGEYRRRWRAGARSNNYAPTGLPEGLCKTNRKEYFRLYKKLWLKKNPDYYLKRHRADWFVEGVRVGFTSRIIYEAIKAAGAKGITINELIAIVYKDDPDGGPLRASESIWQCIHKMRRKLKGIVQIKCNVGERNPADKYPLISSWDPVFVAAVKQAHQNNPKMGYVSVARLLRAKGFKECQSLVGHVIRHLDGTGLRSGEARYFIGRSK